MFLVVILMVVMLTMLLLLIVVMVAVAVDPKRRHVKIVRANFLAYPLRII